MYHITSSLSRGEYPQVLQGNQNDGIKFLWPLHIRHMMSFGHSHPAGTSDVLLELIRIFEESGIVLVAHYDQCRRVNFGEPFIGWRFEVLLGGSVENPDKRVFR